MSTAITVTIQKHFTDQRTLGNALFPHGRRGTVGGLKGSSKNMAVEKHGKGKLDSIKEKKILLLGCLGTPQGNVVQPDSLKPWLRKAMEDVRETELEFGLVWWWDQKTH